MLALGFIGLGARAMAGLVPVQDVDSGAVAGWVKPGVSLKLSSGSGEYVVFAGAGEEVSLALALGDRSPADVQWKVTPEGEPGQVVAEGTAVLTPENATFEPSTVREQNESTVQALTQRVVFKASKAAAYKIEIQSSRPVSFLLREDVGRRPHGVLGGENGLSLPTWVQTPAYFYVAPGVEKLTFTADKSRSPSFDVKVMAGDGTEVFSKKGAVVGESLEITVPDPSTGKILALVSNAFIDFRIPEAGPVFGREPELLLVPAPK